MRFSMKNSYVPALMSALIFHTILTEELLAVRPGVREENTFDVTVHADRPVNRITAIQAVGAGVDGHQQGEYARMLTDRHIAEMRSPGIGPLTSLLRDELAGDVW